MRIAWEEVVKIQYDAMQRSSALYVAILAAIAIIVKEFSLTSFGKLSLIVAFLFVLFQNLVVLYLTNVQRQASWEGGTNEVLNKKENRARWAVLLLSTFATLSIIVTIALVLFL